MADRPEDRGLIFATEDIIIDEPDPHSFFAPTKALLTTGDFVVGQIEVPTPTGESRAAPISPRPRPRRRTWPL